MKIRRFVHRDRFMDSTKYIEYRDNAGYIVDKDGSETKANCYPISDAIKFVQHGVWIELEVIDE